MERGVARPGWAEHVGAVTAAECYVNSDALGDRDEVVCVFSYAGEEPHALVTVVDYNADGMARDGWVTSQVAKLLDHCREASGQRGAEGKYAFRQVDAGQARRMLETALAATDAVDDPPVSESFPSYHAFIRARIRALPPYRGRTLPGATGAAAAAVAQGPAGHARRRVPGLRRGRGPVRPRLGHALRRPHRRLRL